MADVHFKRRTFLATGITAGLAAALPRSASAAPLAELVITGPPAGPSITMAQAIAKGALSFLAKKVSFKVWRNPDELRAGLTSGTMPLAIMPTAAAANLHNRGLGIRLVNVMTDGLLFVIAADPALTSMSALRGKRLAVPFRNDTPEFVAKRMIQHAGLEIGRDMQFDTTGTPIEAIQLVLAGRMDAALVPEPAATAAILRGPAQGKTIHRVMDVQSEWARIAGGSPALPQAGLAVTESFLAANASAIDQVHAELVRVVADVKAAPAAAAGYSAPAFELPLPVIERSIPHSKLVATRAQQARPELERMFQLIAENDMAVIGGRLPPVGFYL
jgi:NitT/TauT family transport system substrate-binding protein